MPNRLWIVGRRRLGLLPTLAAALLGLASPDASAQDVAHHPVASADVVAFRKSPYLQGLKPGGAQIRFELSRPSPATVVVLGPGDERRTIESTDARTFHTVIVDDLAPSTTYRYEVRAASAYAAGSLTTAPADGRPFSFLLYGDSRSDPATHAGIVRGMLRTPSDFLLGTGDFTAYGGDPRDWDIFFAIERKLLADRCLYTAIGNHELYGAGRSGEVAFLQYFATGVESGEPRLYDTFRWSNARFFVLSAMEYFSPSEREWLVRELEKADDEPGLDHRFVVLHIGPYSSGPHGPNQRMHEAGIPELLRKHRVSLVFSGHDHIYERGDAQGLKYMVSGGAGAPLYPVKRHLPTTAKVESTHHWVEVAVDGETVKTRAIRLDGSVIEACSFSRLGPWSCDTELASTKGAETSRQTTASTTVAPSGASRCACSLPGQGVPGDGRLIGLGGLALALVGLVIRRRAA